MKAEGFIIISYVLTCLAEVWVTEQQLALHYHYMLLNPTQCTFQEGQTINHKSTPLRTSDPGSIITHQRDSQEDLYLLL